MVGRILASLASTSRLWVRRGNACRPWARPAGDFADLRMQGCRSSIARLMLYSALGVRGTTVLLPGQRIGNFEVVRWLGRGAFADVYEARQLLVCRPAALKVLTSDQRPSEDQLSEARILASFSHPGIVQIYDAGFHPDPETNRTYVYFATELLKGGTLRDRLKACRRLPVPQAARIALEVCDALACAHDKGVIHRDVKPDNVLLTEEGAAKLGDFGVSRLLPEGQVASSVVGTAPYIAPEGWEGATHQSDIWAVGVMLYEMLSGTLPFTGRTPVEMERCIREDAPRPLGEMIPGLPLALEGVIRRALEKGPARRYARANDLADALRPYALGTVGRLEEQTLPLVTETQTANPPSAADSRRTSAAATRRKRRNTSAPQPGRRIPVSVGRRRLIMVVAGSILGCVAIAFQIWLNPPSHSGLTGSPSARTTTGSVAQSSRASTGQSPPLAHPPSIPPTPIERSASGSGTIASRHGSDRPSVEAVASSVPPQARTGTEARREQAESLYAQARERLSVGERAEAVRLLRSSVAADPRYAPSHMQLAILYSESDSRAAIAELEQVVIIEPDRVGARKMLARAYEQEGQSEKAFDQWRRVLELDPRDEEAKRAVEAAHSERSPE